MDGAHAYLASGDILGSELASHPFSEIQHHRQEFGDTERLTAQSVNRKSSVHPGAS